MVDDLQYWIASASERERQEPVGYEEDTHAEQVVSKDSASIFTRNSRSGVKKALFIPSYIKPEAGRAVASFWLRFVDVLLKAVLLVSATPWLSACAPGQRDDDPAYSTEESNARTPLAAAEVVIEEVDGNPGYCTSKFFLRPHYRAEGLTASLRLESQSFRLPRRRDGNPMLDGEFFLSGEEHGCRYVY